jgi:hypothetical protein
VPNAAQNELQARIVIADIRVPPSHSDEGIRAARAIRAQYRRSRCSSSRNTSRCAGSVSSWLSVAGVDYRYELRRGDEVVATGHLSRDEPLEVGDRLEIGGQLGVVRTIEPLLGEREVRLVVQLVRDRI